MGGIRREEKFFAVYGIPFFFIPLRSTLLFQKKKFTSAENKESKGLTGFSACEIFLSQINCYNVPQN